MQSVNVTYYGHACFMLESGGYRIMLDPYADGRVPGFPPLRLEAEAVCCSHQHGDHNFVEGVSIQNPDMQAPYQMETHQTPHDDQGGALRGMNTIHILNFDGIRVAHLGDIGAFPEREVLDALLNVDCLLIPVGGFYTIDAATAKAIIDEVQPRVCIPMHYRTDRNGLGKIGHLNDFLALCGEVTIGGQSLTLTPDTRKQIHILQYNP